MKDHTITRGGRVIGEIVMDRFCKFAINETKHLMWSKPYGGVPCIDAQAWDAFKDKVKEVYIRTNKGRRFKVPADVFEANKKSVDFGFGKQYWIDKGLWSISGGISETDMKSPTNTRVETVVDKQQKLL